jgi:hypothetical protein
MRTFGYLTGASSCHGAYHRLVESLSFLSAPHQGSRMMNYQTTLLAFFLGKPSQIRSIYKGSR